MKVIVRSTDASATKPLGETHTGAEGCYELELVSAGAEAWLVKAAAVPDGNTHLKRVGTDGFKLKRRSHDDTGFRSGEQAATERCRASPGW